MKKITHLCECFQIAQWVKNLLAIWEMRVQSLGQEDPLEEEIATPPVDRGAWGLQSMRSQSQILLSTAQLGHDSYLSLLLLIFEPLGVGENVSILSYILRESQDCCFIARSCLSVL